MTTKKLFFILFITLTSSINAQWTSVGSLWFSDSSRTFPRIANFQNKPLVSFGSAKDSLVDAYIFDNGTWQQFGQPNFAKGHSYFSRMVVSNDSVYFSYREVSLKPSVSKYANGTWTSLGSPNTISASGLYPIIYKDTLFLSLIDFGSATQPNCAKYTHQTNSWFYNPSVPIVSQTAAQNSYMAQWGDTLFAAFHHGTDLNIYKYFAGKWLFHSYVGNYPTGTPQISLKVNPFNNSFYVAVHIVTSGNLLVVKKFVNGVWQNQGPQRTIISGTTIQNIEMDFVNSIPFIIFQQSNIVKVNKFDGLNTWIDISPSLLVPDICDNTSMTVVGDTIFAIMRRKSDNKISVIKYPILNLPATIIAPTTLTVCAGASGINIPIKIRDENTTTFSGIGAVSSNTTLISNSNIFISGSDSMRLLTFSLNNGVFGNSIITFSVTDNDGNISQAFIQIHTAIPQTPDICEVTVDSAGIYNEIYWEKSMYPEVDSFIVYREVSTSIYKRIGATSKNDLCQYVDTNRSIGPNNGNPNLTSYKYKLQLKDSCGNLSALSLWHQTLFIQDQQNGNFNWNPYTIEPGTSPVSNYDLIRRDLATGTETIVGTTSSNLFTDPLYSTLWNTNIKWYVDAAGFNCDPTQKVAAQKVKTKSNHANDRLVTKVTELNFQNEIKIYPNPAKEKLTVETGAIIENLTIELNNLLGQTLLNINATERSTIINISNYISGIYFLTIKSNNKTVNVKKIVID